MCTTREEKKQKTKKAILAAAVELFAKNGFEKTSISQLARTAGVGKGTVYGYFKTKQDILQAFCEDELEYIREQLTKKTNSDAPVIEQLVTIFMAEFEYVTRNPEFGRLYMQEMVFPRKVEQDEQQAFDNPFFDMIFPILQKAQNRGELRSELELLHLCGHFFALFLLLIHAWYANILESKDAEEAITSMFSQALVGLQPPLICTNLTEEKL